MLPCGGRRGQRPLQHSSKQGLCHHPARKPFDPKNLASEATGHDTSLGIKLDFGIGTRDDHPTAPQRGPHNAGFAATFLKRERSGGNFWGVLPCGGRRGQRPLQHSSKQGLCHHPARKPFDPKNLASEATGHDTSLGIKLDFGIGARDDHPTAPQRGHHNAGFVATSFARSGGTFWGVLPCGSRRRQRPLQSSSKQGVLPRKKPRKESRPLDPTLG